MTTVIDQASPWLMPSSALAATTQAQLGATAIRSGTGSAAAQPRISRRRRPRRSAPTPATRLVSDLASPNATMKLRTAALDASPKSTSPIKGRVERSRPTIAPTKALTATSRQNWGRFSRSPSRTAGEPVGRAAKTLGLRENPPPRPVGGDYLSLTFGGRGDIAEQRLHECVLGVVLQRPVVELLETDRRCRVTRETSAADRAGVVGRIDEQVVRQGQ